MYCIRKSSVLQYIYCAHDFASIELRFDSYTSYVFYAFMRIHISILSAEEKQMQETVMVPRSGGRCSHTDVN